MGNRSCSKIPAKRRVTNTSLRFASWTARSQSNSGWEAPEGFRQMVNGQSPFLPGTPGQVTLVPTGAGQPRTIPTPGLEQIYSGSGHFMGDGKHIAIYASEHGHAVRCYAVDINGGKPIPITPEGITGGSISPNGKYVVRDNDAGISAVYPIGAGAAPHPIPNLESGFIPIQWAEDESSIYGYRRGEFATKVYKVECW